MLMQAAGRTVSRRNPELLSKCSYAGSTTNRAKRDELRRARVAKRLELKSKLAQGGSGADDDGDDDAASPVSASEGIWPGVAQALSEARLAAADAPPFDPKRHWYDQPRASIPLPEAPKPMPVPSALRSGGASLAPEDSENRGAPAPEFRRDFTENVQKAMQAGLALKDCARFLRRAAERGAPPTALQAMLAEFLESAQRKKDPLAIMEAIDFAADYEVPVDNKFDALPLP